jgi:DNA polymerase-3 subunit delta
VKIRPADLDHSLARGLAPVYLVSGDEPLQIAEAGDAIRTAVRSAGAVERDVLYVEAGFDWGSLVDAYASRSLFSERRLVELRITNGRPGKTGGELIASLMENVNPDTTLLVVSGRPDRKVSSATWFKKLEQAGVHVEIWPVDSASLPGWIGQRMAAVGLQPQGDAAQWLAERVEGNLLAASQEIEKLLLLQGPGPVTSEQVDELVANSARFDPFDLLDTVLQERVRRGVQMVNGLRSEGAEPIRVLAALCWALRLLVSIARAHEQGESLSARISRQPALRRRQRVIEQGIRRLGRRELESILCHASLVDRIAKGAVIGDAWGELTALILRLAGRRMPDQMAYDQLADHA